MRRASDVLRDITLKSEDPRISLRELVDGLGDRAFGIAILIFALPNCIPGPPGVGSVLALPPIIFFAQMLAGRHKLWLPQWLLNKSFQRAKLCAALNWAAPKLTRLEDICRPRLVDLTRGRGERIVAAWLLFLNALVIIPLPLTNMLPSIATVIVAVGLIERDGIAVSLGSLLGIPAALVALASITLVFKGLSIAFESLF
jgi:hypothetical protein